MALTLINPRVTIHATLVFRCMDCGAVAAGDRVTIETETLDLSASRLARNVSNHHMPVGWASYSEGHRCPVHVR